MMLAMAFPGGADTPAPPSARIPTLVPPLRFESVPSGNVELGALTGGEVRVRAVGGTGTITLDLETSRADVVTLAAPNG